MTQTADHAAATAAEFDALLEVMRRLRDPQGGCPWDLEQTHLSLRNTLVEEAYEALEAIDSEETDAMVEELGDLMFQTLFHAQIGADAGRFTMRDMLARLREKLVRRHPHVFADAAASSAREALGQWEALKAQERQAKGAGARSMLDGVPRSMPALAYAQAAADRAARAGFAFEPDETVLGNAAEVRDAASAERREDEVGDALFAAVVNAARIGVDAEAALRGANRRFAERFRRVEQAARGRGERLADMEAGEKRALWEAAKAAARP